VLNLLFGDLVPVFGDLVPLFGELVPLIADLMPLIGDFLPLFGDFVPLFGDFVPFRAIAGRTRETGGARMHGANACSCSAIRHRIAATILNAASVLIVTRLGA
jgi:hypothetical protein